MPMMVLIQMMQVVTSPPDYLIQTLPQKGWKMNLISVDDPEIMRWSESQMTRANGLGTCSKLSVDTDVHDDMTSHTKYFLKTLDISWRDFFWTSEWSSSVSHWLPSFTHVDDDHLLYILVWKFLSSHKVSSHIILLMMERLMNTAWIILILFWW